MAKAHQMRCLSCRLAQLRGQNPVTFGSHMGIELYKGLATTSRKPSTKMAHGVKQQLTEAVVLPHSPRLHASGPAVCPPPPAPEGRALTLNHLRLGPKPSQAPGKCRPSRRKAATSVTPLSRRLPAPAPCTFLCKQIQTKS